MAKHPAEHDSVEQLAEEYRDRLQRGENPAISEYVEKYPKLAEQIRDLFPAMEMMERLMPASADLTGAVGEARPAQGIQLERLGDFRILREVGRGGMGIVFEAEQESLGRRVALKVLPSQSLLDPRHQQRFEREARAAARLHHTNIVPVYGVGVQDGMHYYVMQFIEGLGLDQVLKQLRRLRKEQADAAMQTATLSLPTPVEVGNDLSATNVAQSLLTGRYAPAPVPANSGSEVQGEETVAAGDGNGGAGRRPTSMPRQVGDLPHAPASVTISEAGRSYWHRVAHIGIQVADAIDYAASQGILHRDIKPANLLLDGQGNVWVTDFGLAKAATDGQDLTHTGDIVGTLRYMAPERFEGCSDIRGDLYSVGLTLYELVVHRPAYEERDRSKLIHQVTHQDPPALRKLEPAVPRDLQTIITKAIARDPAHRYQTAKALVDDLTRFVEDRPIKARRASVRERLWRWCRRNRLVAASLAGLILSLVVGTGLSSYFAVKAREESRLARAQERLGEARLYDAEMFLAYQAARSGDIAQALGRLRPYETQEAGQPDLRGWEWSYLRRLCTREFIQLDGHRGQAWALAFSRDGRTLATGGSSAGHIVFWDTRTGQRRLETHGIHDHITALDFSPDGRLLAAATTQPSLHLWNTETAQLERSIPHAKGVSALAFSSDGQLLATAAVHEVLYDPVTFTSFFSSPQALPEVKLWSPGTEKAILTLPNFHEDVSALAFSPDCRHLATASKDKLLRIWDVKEGRLLQTLKGHDTRIRSVVYGAKGERLLSADYAGNVKTWNLTTGKETSTLATQFSDASCVALSADGRRVAMGTLGGSILVWDLATGQRTFRHRGQSLGILTVAFSPNGDRIASASRDGTVKIWKVGLQPDSGVLRDPGRFLGTVAYNRDGSLLASTGGLKGTEVRLWDPATGQVRRLLSGHKEMVRHAAFSLDGKQLATDDDHEVKIWDVGTGKEVTTLRPDQDPRSGVAHLFDLVFSPDGKYLITVDANRSPALTFWDATRGVPAFMVGEGVREGVCLACSPDGQKLAVGTASGKVVLLSLQPLEVLTTLTGHTYRIASLAFSPDSRLLASGGHDQTLNIWDLETGQAIYTWSGLAGQPRSASFSQDGRRLAVAIDQGVTLWDITTGQEILSLEGHTAQVNEVTFSPDGRHLASCASDGTIRIWDATPEEALRPVKVLSRLE
jgi:WD40 repeat protein/serine/threonine protein kinase